MGVVVVVAVTVAGLTLVGARGSGGAVPSASDSVLSPAYAARVGFPYVVKAAKASAVTTEKGCPVTDEAVYEDSSRQTALVSNVLNCRSAASAAGVLAAVRKHSTVDPAIPPPRQLGNAAFATASEAPQYLVVWKVGSRVAITAIDVDVAGAPSSSSTAPAGPLTASQQKTLQRAALQQDSLYR